MLVAIIGILATAVLALILRVSTLVFLSTYIFKKIREGNISFQEEEIIVPYSNKPIDYLTYKEFG